MNAQRPALQWPRPRGHLFASRGYPRDLEPLVRYLRLGSWETALEGSGPLKSLFSRRIGTDLDESLRFPVTSFVGTSPSNAEVKSWQQWSLDSHKSRKGSDEIDLAFSADIVFRRHKHHWLLVDLFRRQVLRLSVLAPFSVEWEALRKEYQKFVPGPEFEVLPGRYAVLETYLSGEPLSETLGPAERLLLQVLTSRVQTVAESLQICPADVSLEDALSSSPFAEARERRLEIMGLLDGWPLVPSHGDIKPSHVRIRSGLATLLDFGNFGLRLPSYDFFAALRISEGTVTAESLACLQASLRCEGGPSTEGNLRLVELAHMSMEWRRTPYPLSKRRKHESKVEAHAGPLR